MSIEWDHVEDGGVVYEVRDRLPWILAEVHLADGPRGPKWVICINQKTLCGDNREPLVFDSRLDAIDRAESEIEKIREEA